MIVYVGRPIIIRLLLECVNFIEVVVVYDDYLHVTIKYSQLNLVSVSFYRMFISSR